MYVFHGMNLFFKTTLTDAGVYVFFPILVGKHSRLFLELMDQTDILNSRMLCYTNEILISLFASHVNFSFCFITFLTAKPDVWTFNRLTCTTCTPKIHIY